MMNKTMWARPNAKLQEFAANEYVAACYDVACKQGSDSTTSSYGDWVEGGEENSHWGSYAYGNACTDHSGSCGTSSNNVVTTDANGAFIGIYEVSSDQGKLSAAFDSWIDSNKNGKYDAGDVVFWHTFSKLNPGEDTPDRRWNHWGTLVATNPQKPNHS